MAYAITLLLILELPLGIATLVYLVDRFEKRQFDWSQLILSAGSLVGVFLTILVLNRGLKARPARALELAKRHKIDPRVVAERLKLPTDGKLPQESP